MKCTSVWHMIMMCCLGSLSAGLMRRCVCSRRIPTGLALRLANELQIDVNEICSASPFSDTIKEEEIYPTLPDGLNGALDASRVKTYLKNSMYPLMYLFGKNSMPDVDNLLTSFYQLDDEARQEVVETIRLKLQYHRDPKRAEQIKQIKGW